MGSKVALGKSDGPWTACPGKSGQEDPGKAVVPLHRQQGQPSSHSRELALTYKVQGGALSRSSSPQCSQSTKEGPSRVRLPREL